MRATILAHLVATLRDFDAIDTPAEAACVTEWGQWAHPARLGNAFAIALQLEQAGLADFGGEANRAHFVRAFAPHAAAWRYFNARQGCLPGIATPLPMSRKGDAMLAQVAQQPQAQDRRDAHPYYNRAVFTRFVCHHGHWDIYAKPDGYCAAIPSPVAAAAGCKGSHFGDAAYVRAVLGVEVPTHG